MRHPEQSRRPEDIRFLSDPPGPLPAPHTMMPMPDLQGKQWVLKVPDPNLWNRFWTWLLLGWRWERR